MTLKQFQTMKIVVAIVLASVVAQAVILNNYYLAAAGVVISVVLITAFKRQVKEVIADERDFEIAGKAARYALSAFAIGASVATFIFLSLRRSDPIYEAIGSVLAYATCALLLIYSVIYNYLKKKPVSINKKIWFFITATALFFVLAIAGLRLFTPEDNWICQNGQWVKHGNPSAPMPVTPCQ